MRDKKNPIKVDGSNHHTNDEREGQKKVKKCGTCKNQRREEASLSQEGRKLCHPQPF